MTIEPTTEIINENEPARDVTILVCTTCRRPGNPEEYPRPGATLAARTLEAAQGTGLNVKRVRCLANCSRGLSAALRRNDAWTYVFGLLDPENDSGALLEGARLLANSDDGLMPWRGRPSALKAGLIARVPPLDFVGDEE